MRVVLPLACVIALAAIGCGGDPPIVLTDSGGGTDAGTGTDTGGGVTDTGVDAPVALMNCGSVDVTTFESLPASCLPRCAMTTLNDVAGCGASAMCQQNAVAADTRMGALVTIGGTAEEFTCNECFNYQIQHCIYGSCPDELTAYVTCFGMDPATADTRCATEAMAVNTCQMVMENMTAINACNNSAMGAVGCFGP